MGVSGITSVPQLLLLGFVPHGHPAEDTHLCLGLRLHSLQGQTLGAKKTTDEIELQGNKGWVGLGLHNR